MCVWQTYLLKRLKFNDVLRCVGTVWSLLENEGSYSHIIQNSNFTYSHQVQTIWTTYNLYSKLWLAEGPLTRLKFYSTPRQTGKFIEIY